MKVKVEGLKELDAALGELSKSLAKGTLRRALKQVAEPIAEQASNLAPERSGKLKQSIGVSTKAPPNTDPGKIAYSQVLRGGGDSKSASAALRAARKANPGTFAQVFIGPGAAASRTRAAVQQEFGNVNHGPKAYMRPAFEVEKMNALDGLAETLGAEIEKTRKRVAKRAAKKAAG